MLGDFIRGRAALETYTPALQRGILLHRHIDAFTDTLPLVADLRVAFMPPFRRYSGIIIDLGLDYELARRWGDFGRDSLEDFDRGVREMLAQNAELLPHGLIRFMAYADRRGLFAAYRYSSEILYSLVGVGTRLSRPNPLHRVDEIWPDIEPRLNANFEPVFEQVQSEVAAWLKSKSTITGS